MKKLFSSLTLFAFAFSLLANPLVVFAQAQRDSETLLQSLWKFSDIKENFSESLSSSSNQDKQSQQSSSDLEKERDSTQKKEDVEKRDGENETSKNQSEEKKDKKDQETQDQLKNTGTTTQSALPPPTPQTAQELPKSLPQDPLTFLKGLQGSFETELFTGAATYHFPITLPQGRGNTTPSVNLTYSSTNTSGNSMVGLGWNLTGSSIYRSSAKGVNTLYSEKDFSAEIFGSSSELVALDLPSPNSFEGKYGAKIEGAFSDYTFQNNAWIVTDKTGTKYFFGSSDATRQSDPQNPAKIYKWLLEKIEDTNGNTATFTYFKDSGQVYPDTIRYSGSNLTPTDPGLYEVKFYRIARPNKLTSYLTGFKVETNYLISKIEVLTHLNSSTQSVRTYELNYNFGNNTNPKLSQITIKGGNLNLPPLKFFYFNGNEGSQNSELEARPIDTLKRIEFPAGAIQEITYKKSTAYRTPAQGIANTSMPFAIDTVKSVKVKASANDPFYTTSYEYSGGHYYFDQLDAYKKEYAGFQQVKVTDTLGNFSKMYFHQSEFAKDNALSAPLGEFEDHISKKGKIYREETYDKDGKLYKTIIRKWDKLQLPGLDAKKERIFPFLKRQTQLDYDGDNTAKATASEYIYDGYGNTIQNIDYGEVTPVFVNNKTNGDFTDILSDKIVSETQYASNTAKYIFAAPKQETLKDSQGNTIREIKTYYDNLPLGQLDQGNNTKKEIRRDSQGNFLTLQTQYNALGLPIKFINARNFETTITYDTYNLFPETVTNAKNQSTHFVYDYGYGVATEVTDPNGVKTLTLLDDLGRVKETKVSDPVSPPNIYQFVTTSTISYDTASYPNSLTKTVYSGPLSGNLDIVTKTYFDGLGRVIQTKAEAEGQNQYTASSLTYDELGNVKKEFLPKFTNTLNFEALNQSDPGTTYTYDTLGRKTKISNTLGDATTTFNDWIQTIIDPDGKKKTLSFDAWENLKEVKEYLNGSTYTTAYDYDLLGNLTKITDAKGNIRNMAYDLLNHKLSQEDLHLPQDLSFGTWNFTYDENGNLKTLKDPKNQTTSYSYDELDRIKTEDTDTLAGVETTYTYDQGNFALGKLSQVTINQSPQGNIPAWSMEKSLKYDLLGRIIQEQKTIDGQTYTTQSSFDLLGNTISLIYPDGMNVSYEYNNAGLLEKVKKDGTPVLNNFDYAPVGQIKQIDYANGVQTINTYDSAKLYRLTQKLTTKGQTKLQDLNYIFDPVGNITEIDDNSSHHGAKKAVYTYDDLHRLKTATITNSANGQNYTHTYEYDILGNILNRTDSGSYEYAGGVAATANATKANPHAVTKLTTPAVPGPSQVKNFSYDANGNLISDGNFTHSWDYKDRLISSTGIPEGANPSNPQTLAYFYDESGERVKKFNQTTNKETIYVNDFYEKEGTTVRKHLMAGKLSLATVEVADPQNPATAQMIYHHNDHLSGSNVDTDSQGQILELLDYYPFGNTRLDEKSSAYENHYKYTGKELDLDTNLYYYGARYYDAELGRFLSLDPWNGDLTDPQSFNKYSYVRNNPMKYLDPTGKEYKAWGYNIDLYIYSNGSVNLSVTYIEEPTSPYITPKYSPATDPTPIPIFKAPVPIYTTPSEGPTKLDLTPLQSQPSAGKGSNVMTSQSRDFSYVQWWHIKDHFSNTQRTGKVSKFNSNNIDEIKPLIEDTILTGKLTEQGTDTRFEKTFEDNIGLDPDGNSTKTLRVIRSTDKAGDPFIKTAYPIKQQ